MSQIQHSLAKIENLLATLVGSRTTTTKRMGPAEFVHYAHGQITKAIVEPPKRSTRRLKALYDSVQVFKDNYTNEESERINVPVFVEDDLTAMADKSTTLTAITAAAGAAANQSVFTQGFVAKVAALKGQLEALLKTLPDEDDEPEEKKKKADEDEDEDEKEGEDDDEAAQADKKKAADEDDEAPDSEKKAAAADDDEKEKTAKVRKGVDRSPDGTKWPADVNDPAFIKDGVVTKKLNWGADPS